MIVSIQWFNSMVQFNGDGSGPGTDLVGEYLARLVIDDEFGAFLIGLLDDGVLDLSVDPFVRVRGLHLRSQFSE